jgi:hypothetical protein
MTATVVRYVTRPEAADENQRWIEAVFADLHAREPEGFTYKVFRLDDGVSFIHVVIEHDDIEHPDSLEVCPRSKLSSRELPRAAKTHPSPRGRRWSADTGECRRR